MSDPTPTASDDPTPAASEPRYPYFATGLPDRHPFVEPFIIDTVLESYVDDMATSYNTGWNECLLALGLLERDDLALVAADPTPAASDDLYTSIFNLGSGSGDDDDVINAVADEFLRAADGIRSAFPDGITPDTARVWLIDYANRIPEQEQPMSDDLFTDDDVQAALDALWVSDKTETIEDKWSVVHIVLAAVAPSIAARAQRKERQEIHRRVTRAVAADAIEPYSESDDGAGMAASVWRAIEPCAYPHDHANGECREVVSHD